MERGFIVGSARDNVLRLLPPYVTPKKAFTEFLLALQAILAAQPALSAPAMTAQRSWQAPPNELVSNPQGAVSK